MSQAKKNQLIKFSHDIVRLRAEASFELVKVLLNTVNHLVAVIF
jgi:hypothetical protein